MHPLPRCKAVVMRRVENAEVYLSTRTRETVDPTDKLRACPLILQ